MKGRQLSFDDMQLRVATAGLPSGIATPIVRWRRVLRVMHPPAECPASVRSLRAVGQVLADYADKNGGSCRPSVPTIAAGAGVSVRTAQYALRALEQLGLIRSDRVGGKRSGGHGKASRYQLICPPTPEEKPVGTAVDSRSKGAGTAGQGCNPLHPRSVKERSVGANGLLLENDLGKRAQELAGNPLVLAGLERARSEGMTDAEFWARAVGS